MAEVKELLGLQPSPGNHQHHQQQQQQQHNNNTNNNGVTASPQPPHRRSLIASPSPSPSRERPQRQHSAATASHAHHSHSQGQSLGKVHTPLAPSSRVIIPSPGPAAHWSQVPIKSSARQALLQTSHDDTDLYHWVKALTGDYRFAKFNKSIRFMDYSKNEYQSLIHCVDSDWSRDETDQLMALCRQYDLRFIVIHDRYNTWSTDTRHIERSIEELKSRFYTIQQLLLTSRNSIDPDLKKHPLFTSAYNAQYEIERKKQLQLLFSRSNREVETMATATLEHRKLVHAIKKAKRDSKGVSGGGGRARKRVATSIPEHQLAPVPEQCQPSPAVTSTAALSQQPVFLRSTQLNHQWKLNPKEVKLLDADLAALSVKKPRDIIATGPVVELYDKLRVDLLTLSALTKHVNDRESMLAQLKTELGHANAASMKRQRELERERERDEKELGASSSASASISEPHRSSSNSSISASASGVSAGDKDKREKKEKKKRDKERLGDRCSDSESVTGAASAVSVKKKEKRKLAGGTGNGSDSEDRGDKKKRKKA